MQPRQHPSNREIKQIINAKRNRKKADLTKEFEDFKQRIQEFEDKNDEIIGRIRQAYTQKKKEIQRNTQSAYPLPHHPQPQRVVYYDSINDSESVESSVEYSKNAVYEGNGVQHIHKSPRVDPRTTSVSAKASPHETPLHSYQQVPIVLDEYTRMPNHSLPIRTEESEQYPAPPVYSARQAVPAGFSRSKSTISLERYHELERRNDELAEDLQAKSKQLNKMKNVEGKFKNYTKQVKNIIEDELESYHEEFICERMAYMERYMRKCEQRLSRLNLRLRDAQEDKRAKRTLKRSRERRGSRSKIVNESIDAKDMSIGGRGPPDVPNRSSRVSSQQRQKDTVGKQQEYEEIASGYESIIRGKEEEISKLEHQLKSQAQAREITEAQLQKIRIKYEGRQREIDQLKAHSSSKSITAKDESGENKKLKEVLQKVKAELGRKEAKQREQQQLISRLEKSKKQIHQEYLQNLTKVKNNSNQSLSELQGKIKTLQAQHEQKVEQFKDRLMKNEKTIMDKECEVMLANNKAKKIEGELRVKEEKVRELEFILLKDEHGDLERSVSLDQSMHPSVQLRALQANIKTLDDELELKSGQVFRLERELQLSKESQVRLEKDLTSLSIQKNSLESKVKQLQVENSRSAEQESRSGEKSRKEEYESMIEQLQAEKDGLMAEKETLIQNNSKLFEELKVMKQSNLNTRRQLIKVSSELTYIQQENQIFEGKLSTAKQELSQARNNLTVKEEQLRERQSELNEQIKEKTVQIQQLKTEMATDHMRFSCPMEDKEEEQLMNSLHVSEISFNFPKRLQEDAQLREKLKEAEAALQIKISMEEQIRSEYKANLDKLRAQTAQKLALMEDMEAELRDLKRERATGRSVEMDESLQAYKKELYEGTIVKLEEQVAQLEEEREALQTSEKRANDLLHEFMDKIKHQIDNEKEDLRREVQEKGRAIAELKEIMELRDVKLDPRVSKESIILHDHSIGLDDHSLQDQAELSMMSNISDVFKRDDILQERIRKGKSSREEQVKLFEKTAAYIKSLKSIIELKDNHIRLVEDQLNAQKNKESVGKSVDEFQQNWQQKYKTEHYEQQLDEGPFKDYDSVQLEGRRTKMFTWGRQLQHERNLSIEENKMLAKQIEMLQDEIQRAEEQENSLVRIKDLYKDEIRKLMEKNEQHTKEFHEQINKLREELDSSESYHNWEAIKQLVMKVVGAIGRMQDDPRNLRRQDIRRELEEYVKVLSSILAFDIDTRDRLLATLRR